MRHFIVSVSVLAPYFRFCKDILHLFPQVLNLGRLISQKHNKDTNWKTTQQRPQTTRKLGESDY